MQCSQKSLISSLLMFCRFAQKRNEAYDSKREISPYNALPGTIYTNNDTASIDFFFISRPESSDICLQFCFRK